MTCPASNGWCTPPLLGEAHILDENGADLPRGQAGQIYFDIGAGASRDEHGRVTVGDTT